DDSDGDGGAQAGGAEGTGAERPQGAKRNADAAGGNRARRRNGNSGSREGRAERTAGAEPDADGEWTGAGPAAGTATNGDR
ncbi:DUF3153 domain-containing protein, partial [Mycobacterium tuberculosis]